MSIVNTSVVRQKVDLRRTFHFDTRIHPEVRGFINLFSICACSSVHFGTVRLKLKTGLYVYGNPDSTDFQNYFTVQMEGTEIGDQKQDKGEAVSAENETKATREQLVEKTDPTLNSENSETPVSENSPKCGDSDDKNDDSKNGTSCNCMCYCNVRNFRTIFF